MPSASDQPPHSPWIPPKIRTGRLLIDHFQSDDLYPLLRLQRSLGSIYDNDDHAHWLSWSIDSRAEYARLQQPPYGELAVKIHTGQLVGLVGLVPCLAPFGLLPSFETGLPPNRFTPEVGLYWAVHPDHRGRGYAHEAATALIREAFAQLNLARLVATTTHDNPASIAVMRSLGMTIEFAPADEAPPWFQVVGHLNRPEPLV